MKSIQRELPSRVIIFLICFIMIVGINATTLSVNVRDVSATSVDEALEKYKKDIIASARKTGVWASVTAAQFVYESGNPLSDLAENHNNFFGIRWAGSFAEKYPGASEVSYSNGSFTHFPKPEDSITEHSTIFWNGYYPTELSILKDLNSDRDSFLKALGNGAYCPGNGGSYYSNCMAIIKSRGFDEWDKLAFPDGRKFCGNGTDNVGEYNYPDDGYNSSDVENNPNTETEEQEDGSKNLVLSEWDLVGMSELGESKINKAQEGIELQDDSSLGITENYKVKTLGSSISTNRVEKLFENLRVAVVFTGLCLIFYCVLLFMGTIFDRVNQFVEISIIGILTLGKLTYTDEAYAKGSSGYVTGARMSKLIIVTLIFGLFLVSGGIFSVLSRVYFWLLPLIG